MKTQKPRIIRAWLPRYIRLAMIALILVMALVLKPVAAFGFGVMGMIIDAQHLFSDAQALSATGASTNIIDLGSDRNIGLGEPMAVVVTLDVAADRTTGDETYTVQLQTDDNAAFSSAANVGGAYALAQYTIGSRFVIPIPAGIEVERFLRLNYTLGGTTPSFTVTAFLTPLRMVGAGENVYYADAISIG